MLIKALCEYADKQAAKDDSKKIPDGFAEQEIDYRIVLSENGDMKEIIPFNEKKIIKDKKGNEKFIEVPRKACLPARTQKPGIDSNYIEHRPLYIFGLNYEDGVFTPDDRTGKARKSHKAFVEHELEFFDGLDSQICTAYRKFIEKWVPENETENDVLKQLGKEYQKAYFGFTLGVGMADLEADEQFIEKYQKSRSQKEDENSNSEISVCGILGEKLPQARLHDKIMRFPGGQASGCQLVCMNDTAFESYGKTQSFNSNVSEAAMKKYTATLNKLLASPEHHVSIGDMVIVYFAMKNDDLAECSLFSALLGMSSDDEKTTLQISTIMSYAKGGYSADKSSIDKLETDNDVTFYIAGLTANSSRICQKFIYRDKFGNMLKNLIRHQSDLNISEDNTRPVYFNRIAKELVSPKSSNDKVPPPLMTGIMLAAFNGAKYPDAMLSTAVRRVKTDSDEEKNQFIKLNDTRAGIIKACLNRKNNKEEFTLAWNDENKNPAYLCGGLFAVYEKIQQESSGGNLNRTIKDAYFASACSRPASVFPKLAKLSQNHMRKLGDGKQIYYDRLIGSVCDGFDGEYPQTLSLDDQGRFIIGYYQMNKKLYTSEKSE
ncbi:CRISPR-associated protein Csd1 [Ruminococcus flavefaciens]|uniref:CRISPR-associated protein Csd1 n=1 Tax=Ruminococcus flavefaciens TaxID=1265 RepID=A0A1H6HVM3_RUMFL|nr:type I-C CRISPR-associated protein Cas8c/Csd1 [Ruminococcus flavefaciens]SEH38339.1 CRISPR-associated protein Csd1 [Ruminococcus flavefaciens]